MSRLRIEHPSRSDIYAEAGVDHAVGPFWVEVFRVGRHRPIKSLDFFTHGRAVTLQDCFEFLIAEGFVTRTQLEAALAWMQDGELEPEDMRVVDVVLRLKAAAD